MKIRNGFVSNSSSSSFVIRYQKDVDIEEVKKIVEGMIDEALLKVKNNMIKAIFSSDIEQDEEKEDWLYIYNSFHDDGDYEELLGYYLDIKSYDSDKIEIFKD